MASLFKPDRPCPLPANAEIVTREGKPHVRLRVQGKTAHYPLTADGKRYLRPAAKWAADVVHADGQRKRVRFSPNKVPAEAMLADLLRRIEAEKAGYIDRHAEHRKTLLARHLDDWLAVLTARGRDAECVVLKKARVKAILDSCQFVFPRTCRPSGSSGSSNPSAPDRRS
jgi:hypothetical protein